MPGSLCPRAPGWGPFLQTIIWGGLWTRAVGSGFRRLALPMGTPQPGGAPLPLPAYAKRGPAVGQAELQPGLVPAVPSFSGLKEPQKAQAWAASLLDFISKMVRSVASLATLCSWRGWCWEGPLISPCSFLSHSLSLHLSLCLCLSFSLPMKHVPPARSHSKSWGHDSEGDRRCSWLLSVWLGTHKMNQQVKQ